MNVLLVDDDRFVVAALEKKINWEQLTVTEDVYKRQDLLCGQEPLLLLPDKFHPLSERLSFSGISQSVHMPPVTVLLHVILLLSLIHIWCPMLCISITLRTEMLHRLRRLQICRLRTGFFNHLTKLLRILKHRAWTKHIFIKRLTVMICHENRTLQCFQQSIFINICIRIMDKYTWVYITIRIDMKVTSSSCKDVYKRQYKHRLRNRSD